MSEFMKWMSRMVDPKDKTWNTFFEIALEWESDLKKIYNELDKLIQWLNVKYF